MQALISTDYPNMLHLDNSKGNILILLLLQVNIFDGPLPSNCYVVSYEKVCCYNV